MLSDLQTDGTFTAKDCKPVVFAPVLDISQYCCKELVARGGGHFSLAGVVVHEGCTLNSGHYWSCHRWPSGQWTRYDDERVQPVSQEYVLGLQTEAYFLIYEAVQSFNNIR